MATLKSIHKDKAGNSQAQLLDLDLQVTYHKSHLVSISLGGSTLSVYTRSNSEVVWPFSELDVSLSSLVTCSKWVALCPYSKQ